MMIIREKKFTKGKSECRVTLEKDGNNFFVKCDGEVFYKSPNELFATQRFISI